MKSAIPMSIATGLRRTSSDKQANAGISFAAQRGEIFDLLSPNEAGKTIAIRMLTGQIDPSRGEARVAVYGVVRYRLQPKQQIGVVFEQQSLYAHPSPANNLRLSC